MCIEKIWEPELPDADGVLSTRCMGFPFPSEINLLSSNSSAFLCSLRHSRIIQPQVEAFHDRSVSEALFAQWQATPLKRFKLHLDCESIKVCPEIQFCCTNQ